VRLECNGGNATVLEPQSLVVLDSEGVVHEPIGRLGVIVSIDGDDRFTAVGGSRHVDDPNHGERLLGHLLADAQRAATRHQTADDSQCETTYHIRPPPDGRVIGGLGDSGRLICVQR
jgi:hypothetical protein